MRGERRSSREAATKPPEYIFEAIFGLHKFSFGLGKHHISSVYSE